MDTNIGWLVIAGIDTTYAWRFLAGRAAPQRRCAPNWKPARR
jgi:hypothetical protein